MSLSIGIHQCIQTQKSGVHHRSVFLILMDRSERSGSTENNGIQSPMTALFKIGLNVGVSFACVSFHLAVLLFHPSSCFYYFLFFFCTMSVGKGDNDNGWAMYTIVRSKIKSQSSSGHVSLLCVIVALP